MATRGAKRLNDTAALTSRPFGAGENHSVSVSKIDNGYLVRTTSCNDRTGEYKVNESFSSSPPRILPAKLDGRQGGGNGAVGAEGLSTTRSYLGGKGV